jgi:hypothetical protein
MTLVGNIPDYSASIAVGRNVILVRARAREVRGIIGVAFTLVGYLVGTGTERARHRRHPFFDVRRDDAAGRDSYLDPLLERDFTSGSPMSLGGTVYVK